MKEEDKNIKIIKVEEFSENVAEEKIKNIKPPLGVTPSWLTIENRIKELAAAILRYNDDLNANNKTIKRWAREIILYCDLAEQMKAITI